MGSMTMSWGDKDEHPGRFVDEAESKTSADISKELVWSVIRMSRKDLLDFVIKNPVFLTSPVHYDIMLAIKNRNLELASLDNKT